MVKFPYNDYIRSVNHKNCILNLAHIDPVHIARLTNKLTDWPGADVYLHVDKKLTYLLLKRQSLATLPFTLLRKDMKSTGRHTVQ